MQFARHYQTQHSTKTKLLMNIDLCVQEVKDMAAFLNESAALRALELQTEKENWEKQQLEPWDELIQLISRVASDYPHKVSLETTGGVVVFGAIPKYGSPKKVRYSLRTHNHPTNRFCISDSRSYSAAQGADPSDLLPKLIMILAELIR